MSEEKNVAGLPWHRKILYGLTNWGLFAAGATNLAVGTWSAVSGDATIAATSLTAGLVLLFAATIDRFESLKGLGIEAKTRQLDRKIEQADEALRRIKEVTELTGSALIDLNSKMGRWDSAPSPRAAYALAQRVKTILVTLGCEQPSVRQALAPWVETFCRDFASALARPLLDALVTRSRELERERSTIPQPMGANDPRLTTSTAAIGEISTYLEQRVRKIYKLNADEFPDRFLQLFESVPHISPDVVEPIRVRAKAFASSMIELRETLALTNPEPWFDEIEAHRKRE